MDIDVLYFGEIQDIAGTREERIRISEDNQLGDLIDALVGKHGERFTQQLELFDSWTILINGRHYKLLGGDKAELKAGDQVVFLPVTMGG